MQAEIVPLTPPQSIASTRTPASIGLSLGISHLFSNIRSASVTREMLIKAPKKKTIYNGREVVGR